MGGTMLVVGALGVVGRSAIEHFETLPDWKVVGLARRAPNFETKAKFVSADLADRAAVDRALADIGPISHVIYTALFEKPNIAQGWVEDDHIARNTLMLRNLLDAVEKTSPGLRHVGLLQGTKAYGVHLGPIRIPARESQPRHMPPNFYWSQEDLLRERAHKAGWQWTVYRPQLVCGLALGSPMNIVPGLGAYAAIAREFGLPLSFPGGRHPFIFEAADARLLARAMAWAAEAPSAANEIFNVTNGDCFVWQTMWPAIADAFGMEVGHPQPMPLSVMMADKAHVWDRIVEKHQLRRTPYADISPNWQFADFVFAYGAQPEPALVSTIKIRQAGFADCIDTEEMFLGYIREMQDTGLIPRP
jgi:nucleoside-diphosphate-sugar epimerase